VSAIASPKPGEFVRHPEYRNGYRHMMGPACPNDASCFTCTRAAMYQCKGCYESFCSHCFNYRHSHTTTRLVQVSDGVWNNVAPAPLANDAYERGD
jgi:hypothetical protein